MDWTRTEPLEVVDEKSATVCVEVCYDPRQLFSRKPNLGAAHKVRVDAPQWPRAQSAQVPGHA